MRANSLLDEVGHDGIGEVAFEAVPVLDLSTPALKFEFDKRAQATEEMVADGLLAAHEEPLRMADLLEGAMITLDGPMFLMGLMKGALGDFHALFFRGSKAA